MPVDLLKFLQETGAKSGIGGSIVGTLTEVTVRGAHSGILGG